MKDEGFCLGPSAGYTPENDVSLAVQETTRGSSVTETLLPKMEIFIHSMLHRIRRALSRNDDQPVPNPDCQIPVDDEFCCGPTEEWLDAEMKMAIDSSQIVDHNMRCIIGKNAGLSDAQTNASVS